ncbi:MAG: polyphosphate polymerase domain-containing protein [Myxococcales bacterium]|nr:polyphosphate polymerase domain-containing protein [Myxococcales bacterium]MCB9626983.1 polyphosphate polymerase domain-containing protein [Sandaracinaceae bacterium]
MISDHPPHAGQPSVAASLGQLATADLSLLGERALLKRVDTKFALSDVQLASVLASLDGRYAVARVGGAPLDRYETTYFDTPALTFLNQHLRDRRPRYKVRIRHYMGRERSYLEVKQKTSAGATRKWRRELPFGEDALSELSASFLSDVCPVDAALLRPTACTNFDRITLVGVDTMERVTLDLRLQFMAGGRERELGPVVIAEVKQDRQRWRSPIMLALRANHVRALSISKYCAAAALLIEGARVQRYRPRLRELQRLVSRSAEHAG